MRIPAWFPVLGSLSGPALQRGAPTPEQAYGFAPDGQIGAPSIAAPAQPGMSAAGKYWGAWFFANNPKAVQWNQPPGEPHWGLRQTWNLPMDPTGSYHVLRHYDWGAAGFGYKPGQITTNPIGGGIVAQQRVGQATREPGQVAQVANNTFVFYNQQTINWGLQPATAPLLPPDVLAQMLGPIGAPAAVTDPNLPTFAAIMPGA